MLTLSRTGQNNQAHSLVVGHNFVLSSSTLNSLHVTLNKTLNDRPLPEYFTATDLGSRVSSPVPGYVGRQRHRQRLLRRHRRHQPGLLQLEGWQVADDVDVIRGATSSRSAATGFTRASRR